MGNSIREYLERQSTQVLKNIYENYSVEPLRSEYEDSIKILEEILKERENKSDF